MRLDSYPLYKQSGISWYEEIPQRWEVLPLYALAHECSSSNKGMIEDNLLSLSYGKVINKDVNSNEGLLPESFETYQVVEPDDIVLRLTDLQNDKRSLRSAIVTERGIITSAYLAIRPKKVDARFLNYLLRAYDLTKVFYSMGGGLRQSMKFSDVKRLPLILPSLLEQKSIVTFLDHETSKIDTLVVAQGKLIKLLKEKRQAVISNAVTKGLDRQVKMKDSGVEWLGDIPEHWELKKIKWCAKLKNEKTSDRSNTIALENIEGWTGRFIDTESKFEGDGVKFNEDDLLFGKLRPYLAKVFRATMKGEAIGDFFVLEPKQNLLSQFAERLLISSEFIDAINSSTYGTKMPRVNWEYFSSMSIPLPPKHEQIQISNYLVTAIKEMDELIATSNNAVALLEERRTALISAAVTGQIDVRDSYGN